MLADVTDLAQVEAVVARTVERFGRLDVLISNAGVLAPNGRIHNLTDADWSRVIDINLMGSVNAVQAAVPTMRQQQAGSIILTASVAGMTAWSHAAPYCVTKAAVINLAKVAAVEYAGDNIRVNCVCPGTFVSPIHADLPQEAIDAMAAKHPLGLGAAPTSSARTRTSPATPPGGPPARRSSSTAATRPRNPAARPDPTPWRAASARSDAGQDEDGVGTGLDRHGHRRGRSRQLRRRASGDPQSDPLAGDEAVVMGPDADLEAFELADHDRFWARRVTGGAWPRGSRR